MNDRSSLTIIHQALAPYRIDILNALCEAFRVRLYFVFDSIGNQELDRSAMETRLKSSATFLGGGINIFGRRLPWRILSVLSRARGGLVIASEFSPATCLALLARPFTKTKVIVWTDDNAFSVRAESKFRALVRILAVKFADALILVGEEAKQLYPNFKKPIAIVPIICDDRCSVVADSDLPLRAREIGQKFGLSRAKVVLYVGRLAPEKRIDRLIIAFSDLAKRNPSLRLVLVGDGPERNSLFQLVSDFGLQGRVVFAGQQDGLSLWAWFRLGCVFCLPSEQEAFGAVVGEALISGMPAICSHVAGAKELIAPSYNGSIVDASDNSALVEALEFWLANVPAHDGEFARRQTMLRIPFKQVADRLVDMLRKLEKRSNSELAVTWPSLLPAPPASSVASRRRKVAVLQRRLTHYRVPFFEQLRAQLLASNVELQVWHGEPTDQHRRRKDGGVLHWSIPLKTRYFFGSQVCWQPLPKELKDADLVICPQETGLLLAHRLLLGRRIGRFAFWGHGRNFQASPLRLAEFIKRWQAPKADWWFAYTVRSKEHLVKIGVAPSMLTVVNNSIGDSASIRACRRDDKIKRAVFIGTLYKDKHLGFLIRACDEVFRRLKNFELVIVGAGPEMDKVLAQSASRPWMRVLGPLTGAAKDEVLCNSDVMVCPGLVGLNIVDAFHAGLPMLTTRAQFHSPEIAYLEEGINGMATAFQESTYAAALVQIFDEEGLLLRLKNGARTAGEALSLANMVDHFCTGVLACLGQDNFPLENNRRA